jgi:hypothetical protein
MSARTFLFSSIPARFNPLTNLLYEMSAPLQAALIRTIHKERKFRFFIRLPT